MIGSRIRPPMLLVSLLLAVVLLGHAPPAAQEQDDQDLFAEVFGEPVEQDLVLPLFRGGEFLGDLQARVNGEEVRVSAAALESMVEPFLAESALQTIAAIDSSDGLAPLDAFDDAGLFLVYRPERAELNLSVAPESLRERLVGAERIRPLQNLQEPMPFTGYANAYLRGVLSSEDEISTAFLNVEPVLNYQGWVLEASAGFSTAPLTRETVDDDPVSLEYARLVRDFPEYRIRGEAGLVRYRHGTLFSGPEILGISATRLEDIRNDTPLYRSTDLRFVVPRHAPVEIYLNERVYRREFLNEGPHRITDVPLGRGINTLRVEQAAEDTDAPANLLFEEVKPFSPELVQPGRHVYSWGAGLLRDEYTADALFLSGTHRVGVGPQWTAGADLQAGLEEYALGLHSLFASRAGLSRADGAVSFDLDGTAGTAAELSHLFALLYTRRWPVVEVTGTVESPDFRRVSTPATDAGRLRGGVSLNQRLQAGLSTTFGVVHSRPLGGDGAEETTLRLSLAHRSPRGYTLNALISPTFTEGEVFWRGGLFVRFGSEERNLNTTVSYDLVQASAAVQVSNVPSQAFRELQWAADYRRSAGIEDEVHAVGGTVRYEMYRASAQARPEFFLRTAGQDEARMTGQFSTGLVWAGTTLAVTRPIRDSFAIFVPRPEVEGHRILLRPGAGAPSAELAGRAAVVPDLASWRGTTVRVDGAYLPEGLSVGNRDVSFFPGYRSGYRVIVGSAASVYVVGRIVDATTGEPVALEAGEVVPEDDAAPREMFFTNREGRFEIAELRPGRYFIQLLGRPEVELEFDIPDDISGRYELGDVILLEEENP